MTSVGTEPSGTDGDDQTGPALATTPDRLGRHANAFGFLRLLFASLVIVSHTPELVDGDQHREILARLTGTTSFGAFGVAGFFVISGFLITGSFLGSRSTGSYLLKRIARIYPAFIVASIVSLLVVAPLSGAHLTVGWPHAVASAVARMAILARPMIEGAFPGQHYNDVGAALNGPLYTIQYEFTCYLLVVVAGVAGLLRHHWLVALVAIALLIASPQLSADALAWLPRGNMFLPAPASALFRLVGMFLAGASFYGLRDRLRFNRWTMGAALIGFCLTLPVPALADLSFGTFGAFLIFGAARLAGGTRLARINDPTDISYGLYLYAWPVEQLLIRYAGPISLPVLGLAIWLAAAALGLASWLLIEKPALTWARWYDRRRAF